MSQDLYVVQYVINFHKKSYTDCKAEA